LPFEEELP